MLRMKASAVMRKVRMSPFLVQAAWWMSRSKRTWSVWVGVKAVKSWVPGQGRRAGFERLQVDAMGPPEGAALLEGARRRAGQQAVAVAARLGAASGVEAVVHGGCGGDGDVVGPDPVQPPRQILADLGRGDEARHLPKRMHPGIGTPGHGQLHRLAQHRGQSRLQLPLHGPQPRLSRPAAKARAVVFDVQPDRGHASSDRRPASSRTSTSSFSALASFEPGLSPATT